MIGRRQLLAGLTSTAFLDGRAEAQARRTIGMLGSAAPHEWERRLAAFRQGLSDTGYVEGANLTIEYRWAGNRNERLPELAADLVRQRVQVIAVLGSTPSALAVKAATSEIPIVFRIATNPVSVGLVTSLSRPGGNATGVTTLGGELGPKQLELILELVPAARTIALLTNAANPILAEGQRSGIEVAGVERGVRIVVAQASRLDDFDAAFASMQKQGAEALIIGADTFLNFASERLADLAIRHGLPTISPYREFVEAGGLICYGGSILGASRQAAFMSGEF